MTDELSNQLALYLVGLGSGMIGVVLGGLLVLMGVKAGQGN